MSRLDASVASVIDRRGLDEDEDLLIEELENEDDISGFREHRLQQLHAEYTRAQQMKKQEHGSYGEVKDEKALMDITTSTKLVLVHFFKSDFNRCRIMDQHLETLASKHLDTRFLRIDVENAPFLVVKLKVQVLPCVLAFVDGISKERIVGFEGIGRGSDSFTTRELESKLLQMGVLLRPTITANATLQPHQAAQKSTKSEDEDSDWD